jgi:transposase
MAKIATSPQFKEYNQAQAAEVSFRLEDLIPSTHLVRVVNEVVEKMDITPLINSYQGGGTTAYHPRMLLKVLLYGYCTKIYTGRKIAAALTENIPFMWLAAFNCPDFRTLNSFRSSKAKGSIGQLFKELQLFLVENGYVSLKDGFTDGSTFQADANKHKMIWSKKAERYKKAVEKKCTLLLQQIDHLNEEEQSQYGDQDLPQNTQPDSAPTSEAIEKQVDKLNEVIACCTTEAKKKRKAESLKKKLEEQQQKRDKYQRQLDMAQGRSGYNKTDEDATAMRMKDGQILPAYNGLLTSENQFIIGVSMHQNSNDAACFKEHLREMEQQLPSLPQTLTADAIFGTEQNYEALDQRAIESYLKYPSFHAEGKKSYKDNPFVKEHFAYDADRDSYTCPNKQLLVYRQTKEIQGRKSGYVSTVKVYESKGCEGCPFYEQCCKGKERNRTITINEKLEKYKQQAREHLKSEQGMELRRRRGMEIESCFGDIKHNMRLRRFHLRGKQKVKTEFTLLAMAHNIRKVHINRLEKLENAA